MLPQICEDSGAGGASNRQLEIGIWGSDGNRTKDRDLGTIHKKSEHRNCGSVRDFQGRECQATKLGQGQKLRKCLC